MDVPALTSSRTNSIEYINVLRKTSEELETVFLTEMLKTAGLGKPSKEFGGGLGEDQFTSFLISEQARALTQSGGIGLASHIFRSLMDQS